MALRYAPVVLRGIKAHRHVALGSQVVDLIPDAGPSSNPSGLRPGGLHLLDHPDQIGAVGQVAVVQVKVHSLFVGVPVQVVYAVGVKA